jgi:hypothetical protein
VRLRAYSLQALAHVDTKMRIGAIIIFLLLSVTSSLRICFYPFLSSRVTMVLPYFVSPEIELSDGSSSIKYNRLSHLLVYTATPRLSPAPCKFQIPPQIAGIFSITNTEVSGSILKEALGCVERMHQYYVQKGSFSYRPAANEPDKVVTYYAEIPAAAVLAYRHPQLSLRLCHVVEKEEKLPSFPYLTNETFDVAGGEGQLRVRTLLGWKVDRMAAGDGVTMAWQVPGQSTEPYPVELLNAVGTDAMRKLHWALSDIIPDDADFSYCGGCGVLRAEGAGVCCDLPPGSDHFTALLPLGRNWVISHEGRIKPYVAQAANREPLAQHKASLTAANCRALLARLVAQIEG